MAVASPKLHGRAQWRAPSSLSRRGHCSHIQANCRGVEQGLSPQPPGTFSNPYGTTYSSPKLFDSQTEYHTSPTPPSKRGGTTLRRRFRTGANGCGAPNAGAGKLIWSLREPSGGNADWRRYCGQLAIRVCDGSGRPGGNDEDLEDNQSHSAIARTGIVGRRASDLMALSILRSAIYRSNGATRAS